MGAGRAAPARVLVTGWPSFPDGEATVGDVLAMEAVRGELESASVRCELAWSPVLRPAGLTLGDARPARYTHLVFACGPLSGPQIARLHHRFAGCRRVAIGVSVIDPADPAAAGFDVILPRARPGAPAAGDLAAHGPAAHGPAPQLPPPQLPPPQLPPPQRPAPQVPVAGVIMVAGQAEYAGRARHGPVAESLADWLRGCRCARLPLETRLDPRDWRLAAVPAQFEAIIARLDLVVTMRLHGLVLALRHGIPALAVDPVSGGAKVSAQARAWGWPAIVTPGPGAPLDPAVLDRWRDWCLSAAGRSAAARAAAAPPPSPLPGLLPALRLQPDRG
jgi:hypothetical protein